MPTKKKTKTDETDNVAVIAKVSAERKLKAATALHVLTKPEDPAPGIIEDLLATIEALKSRLGIITDYTSEMKARKYLGK